MELLWSFAEHVFHIELSLTVVPTKSDSDVILCLELLKNTKVYTSLELTRIDISLVY